MGSGGGENKLCSASDDTGSNCTYLWKYKISPAVEENNSISSTLHAFRHLVSKLALERMPFS